MDLFTKISQNTITDLSMFRTKRTQKEVPKPMKEEPMKQEAKQEETKKTVQPVVNSTTSAESTSADQKVVEKEATEEKHISDTTLQKDTPTEDLPTKTTASVASPKETEKNKPVEQEQGRIIQFKQPENLNEEAAIKLEMQLETAKSNLLPVFPIVRYLKNKCMNDDAFAAVVNDERKTLAKCFEYVTGEVKKALNGPGGWLDDNEVYAYAETYFLTDEAVFEQIAAEKAEAERKRQEEVAQRRKEMEEKRKQANKKKNKEADTKTDSGLSEEEWEEIKEKAAQRREFSASRNKTDLDPEKQNPAEIQEQMCLNV